MGPSADCVDVGPLLQREEGGVGQGSAVASTVAASSVMLTLDPLGVLATTAAGMLVGFLAGNLLVLRWAGMVLLVPWATVVRRDRPLAAYALFANGMFFWTMRPELRQYAKMLDGASDPSQEEIAREYGMGAGLGRALDRWSIPALMGRARRRSGADS